MADSVFFIVSNRIMAIWGLILILCGIAFNFLVCYVCIKSNQLRSNTTFKFLAIIAINDILLCFPWDFDGFTSVFFDYPAYFRNLFYCEYIEVFLQYATINFDGWMYVSISLDRVLSLSVKKWSCQYFNGYRPIAYSAFLALVIVAMNIVSIFKTGYSYRDENGTDVVVCFEDSNESTEAYDIINLVKS